jgi:DNA-binding Lrp family transcriptional regulator
MQALAETIPEVHDAYTVTGESDGLLVVRCTDAGHLEEVLGRIRLNEDVVRTRSSIVLSHV